MVFNFLSSFFHPLNKTMLPLSLVILGCYSGVNRCHVHMKYINDTYFVAVFLVSMVVCFLVRHDWH